MTFIKSKVSSKAIEAISQAVISQEVVENEIVELVIVCEPNFTVRDFISYLRLADRIYGRLLDWNLHSYSQKPYEQLKINEVRTGSFEIVILQEIGLFIKALGMLYLILKYFPMAIKTTSEAAKNFSEAYKNLRETNHKLPAETKKLEAETFRIYQDVDKLVPLQSEKMYREIIRTDEEIQSLRINRKKLELELQEDEELRNLEEKYKKQIPQLIKELLSKEKKDIAKAKRFATNNVKEVKIRKKKKNDAN